MGPDLLVPFAGFAGLMGGRPPPPNLVHLVIFNSFSSGKPVEFSTFFLPVRLFPLSWKGAPLRKWSFSRERGDDPHILSILVFQAVALYTAGKEAAGRGQGGQGGRGGGSCTKGGGFAATK